MRNLLSRGWNKIKWTLFLIIWTLGTVGWMYFFQEFRITRAEANWTIQEVKQLQEKKIEKDDVSLVAPKSQTSDSVQPEVVAVENNTATPPSGEIEKLIYETFKEEPKIALAVAKAESHLNCKAIGDRHLAFYSDGIEYGKSYGVFQIRHLKGRPAPQKLLDTRFNVQYAYEIYKRSGNSFNAWSQYKNGAYKKYL